MVKPNSQITEYQQISSLAASGTKFLGSLDLDDMRTLSLTLKGVTNASAILGLRLNLYYSPSGERDEWDTDPFNYFDLSMTAGSNTQATWTLQNLPEIGKLRFEIENLDTGQAVTSIKLFVGVSVWDIMQVFGDNISNREDIKKFALINQ